MQILQKSQCALRIGIMCYGDIDIIEIIINDGFNQDNKAIIQFVTVSPFQFDCVQQNAEIILNAQLQYKGLVTHVSLKEKAQQDVLEIELSSAMFYLYNDKSNRLFSQSRFKEILQDICSANDIKLHCNNSQSEKIIDLATQYQQSTAEFMQDLLAKHQLFYYSQHDALTILDSFQNDDEISLAYRSLLSLQQKTQIVQYAPLRLKNEFILKSTINTLKPGNIIRIHNHPHEAFNQRFRLLSIKHCYQKTYHNECQLQLLEQPYACRAPQQRYVGMQQGKVIGQDHAHLDEHGQYKVKMPGQLTTMNLHHIRKLVHFSGDGYGHHFPLYANSHALIAYIDGDINKPVIIGSLLDEQQSNVVSQHNEDEKRLQFSTQQFLGFSQKTQAGLTIHNQGQTFHLNAHSGDITLHNNDNNIEFTSALSIKQKCLQLYQKEIDGKSEWQIKNNFFSKANNIKFQYENSKSILLCEKTLFLDAANLNWKIQQLAIQCHAFNIDIQNLQLRTIEKFILHAKKLSLTINSVMMRCGNSSICIDHAGNIKMQSPEISVYAKKIYGEDEGKLVIN